MNMLSRRQLKSSSSFTLPSTIRYAHRFFLFGNANGSMAAFIVLFLVILMVGTTRPGFAASGYCGQISRIRGIVEIHRLTGKNDSQGSPIRNVMRAKRRTAVRCDDVLVTRVRSRCKVKLGKALMSVGPLSRINLSKFKVPADKTPVVDLTYGKMRAFIKPDEKKNSEGESTTSRSSFEVHTATAVAGVRGTDFYVGYDPQTRITEQATLTGAVEVVHRQTQQKAIVRDGEQAKVKPVAASEDPLTSPPPTSTDEPSVEPGAQDEPSGKNEAAIPPDSLTVTKVQAATVQNIREVSEAVQETPEFTHKKAIELLGAPERWKVPSRPLPKKLKDIKNEF